MFEPGTAENSAMSIARPLADVLGTSDLQLVGAVRGSDLRQQSLLVHRVGGEPEFEVICMLDVMYRRRYII